MEWFHRLKASFFRDHKASYNAAAWREKARSAKCLTCQDTGKIIRGRDGQKITCPMCRGL